MIEIHTQIRNLCPKCGESIYIHYVPFGDEDREKSKEHNLFQVVRNKIYGTRKQRSITQMNLYWKACQVLADNTDNKQWNTKEKVDFQCRVAAHFVDPSIVIVRPDGSVQFKYRSIAIKNLGHIEACNYFNQAFGTQVDYWNKIYPDTRIDVDNWIGIVKSHMHNYSS